MATNDFDFSKAAQDFMASMKLDTSAFDGTMKNAADFNAKLTQIALDAAKQNAELTSNWTQEALKKVEAQASSDPADMANVAAAFSAEQSQAMQDKFAAFAEVAKTAQEKTVELFAAAGKEMQTEVAKNTKK